MIIHNEDNDTNGDLDENHPQPNIALTPRCKAKNFAVKNCS